VWLSSVWVLYHAIWVGLSGTGVTVPRFLWQLSPVNRYRAGIKLFPEGDQRKHQVLQDEEPSPFPSSTPRTDHLHPCELRRFLPSNASIMSAPSGTAGYNQLRQQARSLETQVRTSTIYWEPDRQIADSLMAFSRHRTSSTRIRNSPQPLTSRRNHHKMSVMSKLRLRNSWNRYGIPAALDARVYDLLRRSD
jgi:hypothetical protein